MCIRDRAQTVPRPSAKRLTRILKSRFIFEILDGSRESPVLDHVGVAKHLELEHEGNGLAESPVLEDARPDQLPGNLSQHGIGTGLDEVDLRDLRFLMELLRLEFRFLGTPLRLGCLLYTSRCV